VHDLLPSLGQTRSVHQRHHLLQTPDTFVRATPPGMRGGAAIVHVSPALGAGFTQYTAELEPDGEINTETSAQRFLFVLEGTVIIDAGARKYELGARGYAYLPGGWLHRIAAVTNSRLAMIEKPYHALPSLAPPQAVFSSEDAIESHPLDGDPDLQVKCLLPDAANFDFAVNTMVYRPGASLRTVEMHAMEHGLLMLEGGGIYRLGDSWHPVVTGDFIWMAPWCPQWFGAIGKVPAKYLIYKDWNRHPVPHPQR
jgi:(S)-ureidoglycine aminohydrolase